MAREPEFVAERRRALGTQLAAYRNVRGLRQTDVAGATDLDRSTVAHIERGQARADQRFWKRVDDLLQADGALVRAYEELEAAKHEHEVVAQEQRLAALKAQAVPAPGMAGDRSARVSAESVLSSGGARGNLPAEMTSFVGRREEIGQIREVLAAARLVTLTGAGGVGKSRLALRLAMHVRQAFPDGVWLVELAPLQDAALVADAVVEALGIRDQSADGPAALLEEHLRDRQLLLVLDNCEHLLDATAELVKTLLRAAANVRVVATSREPLGLAGEHRWMVSPLAVPDPETPLSAEDVGRFAGLALFAERAAAVRPGFKVTAENRKAVVRLCHRLDGIPLAIELAAARLPTLSVEQIVDRLDDRFRLLSGQRRAVSPRHQTLHAAVEWSYELCPPSEQVLWARVSVFAGGFDLEAAEAVCSGDGIVAGDVVDLVAGLVDKSIVLGEELPGGTRYRLLETLRQFGQDRLRDAGEEAALRGRHRDYYQALVEQAKAKLYGAGELELITRVRREHANLRVALDYCLTTVGEAPAGLAMASGLTAFWLASGGGSLSEGRRWLERALNENPEPTTARAKGLVDCGFLAAVLGDPDAGRLLRQCRALAEQVGDDAILTYAAHWSGVAAFFQRDVSDAFVLLEQAMQRNRAAGDIAGVARALYWMALSATAIGDQRALDFAEEALATAEVLEAHWSRSWALAAVGLARWWQRGERQQAAALFREAIRIKREVRDLWGIVHCVEQLAWVAGSDGQHEHAARLLGAATTVWRLNGMTTSQLGPFERCHAECEQQARTALGDRAFEAVYACGAELSLDEAVTAALGEDQPTSSSRCEQAGSPLTQRERQVAELIAEGLSNKEIADRLVLGHRTVDGYVGRIRAKLGFTSRAQVAAWVGTQR